MSLTGFYIYGLRPVKIFRTPDGGLDCHALNWETGEFERNMSYLSRILTDNSPDVDEVSEPQFDAMVEMIALRRRSRTEADSAEFAAEHLRLADRMVKLGLRGWGREVRADGLAIHRRLSANLGQD